MRIVIVGEYLDYSKYLFEDLPTKRLVDETNGLCDFLAVVNGEIKVVKIDNPHKRTYHIEEITDASPSD